MASQIFQVGMIGAGDIAQIVHIPTLQFLSRKFKLKAICDVSLKTAQHCANRFNIPVATTNAADIFLDPEINLVFVLSSDDAHEMHTIASLQAGKHVMLEKPITSSVPSAHRIIAAERAAPNGARVFVGFQRRYPHSLQAFKRELATINRVLYARIRDILGRNPIFLSQSGAEVEKYVDDIPLSALKERQERLEKLMKEA